MNEINSALTSGITDRVRYDLGRLNIPVHRAGYEQLCLGISLFAEDATQPMCCELYPTIAKALGCYDWRAVEFSIRSLIRIAWDYRNPEIWEEYFPGAIKAPTNKRFIATLALRIK